MATDAAIDLLSKQATILAEYFSKLSAMYADGVPLDAGILILSDELKDVASLQPVADSIIKEMAQEGGPLTDKLMLLSEQGEMLASLQKEYYVISSRSDRIGRASRALSGMKHLGSENGAVLIRIKQAGGSY